MQNLCNQFRAQRCQQHQQFLDRICIELNCKHSSRGMCQGCPRESNQINVVNLSNLFDFLSENQRYINVSAYHDKAQLFQQFERYKLLIIEQMDQLQRKLEQKINSIQGNLNEQLREGGYLTKQINQRDVEAIGEIFSNTIQTTQIKQFKFKQVVDIKQQRPYTEAYDLIQGLRSVVDTLTQLNGEVVQQNQQDNELQQYVNREFKYSQTLQQKDACNQISFNHNETELIAPSYKSILVYSLTQQGFWVVKNEELVGHNNWIYCAQYNHNSTQIVSCGEDKQIIIWNKQKNGQWSIQDQLHNHTDQVCSVSFNHDSTIIASGSKDSTVQIHIINKNKWKLSQKLTEHTGEVSVACFNNKSTLLASGGDDNQIILREFNKGQGKWIIQQRLIGHISSVRRLKFNSESKLLVSGGFDEVIKVWQVDEQLIWQLKQTLTGHTKFISSLHFNKLSNLIVSSSWDHSIKIWRINDEYNWQCIQTINQHQDRVLYAIINANSSMIISASEDKTIIINKAVEI